MRLFVALDIDAAIRERLAEFTRELGAHAPGVRFVKAASFHVTLKFVGESRQLEEIKQALGAIAAPGFALAFRRCGFFPDARRPRVFWAGIEAGAELASLATDVDAALRPLGVAGERGPYTPHLTLARLGSGSPHAGKTDRPRTDFCALTEYLAGRAEPEFGTMTAREFILFESTLSPGGAVYTPLAHFPLSA